MEETEVRTPKNKRDREKMEHINFAYNEQITYSKKAALNRVLNGREEKELVDLAPSRVLLIRKEKIKKTLKIDEMIFLFKIYIFNT